MTYDTMHYMPLDSAYLCQDCDSVGNSSMQCPACASQSLMGLADVFARKPEQHFNFIPLVLPAWAA
jgi:hypothetical protein